MTMNETLSDELWNRMLRFASDRIDDLTMKRGFQYYKQGRVTAYRAEGGVIQAIVEGTDVYKVTIDPNDFGESRCNCPVGRPCKHLAAVLMVAAERAGRSVHAVANARTSLASQPARPLRQPGNGRLQAQAEQEAAGLGEMSVAQWHDWFERCVEPLVDHTRNPHYVKQAWANIQRWKPELAASADKLFELNAYLFLLRKLTTDSFLGYFTNIAAADVKQAVLLCLQRELPPPENPDESSRLADTAAYVRSRFLFKSPHADYFSESYFELWARWMPIAASGDELRALTEAEDQLGADLNRVGWLTARCWIHLLRGEDEVARQLLIEAGRPAAGDVLRILKRLADGEAWDRLADWLAECAPIIVGYRLDTLQVYSDLWEQAVRGRPEEEERMWDAIAGLLPRSGRIYAEKLLQFGRWREWTDYQLSAGHDPLDYRAAELQPIEKADPEALLPFYHQAVERYVQLKNRDGYKQAVKLLKRLAKLYKKAKREDRWSFFFEAFAARHSRLRALQEELRKGKLLS